MKGTMSSARLEQREGASGGDAEALTWLGASEGLSPGGNSLLG